MFIKQLSVFMENKLGKILSLISALGKEGVDLVTLSITDSRDFGIVRFIARDNEKAYDILKKAGFAVEQTELIGVEIPDEPNALAEVLSLLMAENVNIEYMYTFDLTSYGTTKVLLKVADAERTAEILEDNGRKVLTEL